jgi:hypothetical protein
MTLTVWFKAVAEGKTFGAASRHTHALPVNV